MTPTRHLRGIVPVLILAAGAAIYAAAASSNPAPSNTPSAAPASPGVAAGSAAGHAGHSMPPAASSTPDKGQVMTITGEVMDPACFLEAGSKSIGPGHFQCAIDCARSGQTLAIYDRDHDLIYFIAGELPGKNPNEPLMDYIHKKVDVTGVVYHRSGAYGIVIRKVVPHVDKPGGAQAASGAAAGK